LGGVVATERKAVTLNGEVRGGFTPLSCGVKTTKIRTVPDHTAGRSVSGDASVGEQTLRELCGNIAGTLREHCGTSALYSAGNVVGITQRKSKRSERTDRLCNVRLLAILNYLFVTVLTRTHYVCQLSHI
jgi:hypothetical protein